ncbi:hypothetical protein H206_01881 [Candidatus Electrothrix aarhusensis]|jgi:hypothetical protein|uniref:Uncharacterized protein n=1 Tax=Candidatus Electrothrix aarhusensis TaxID=1859131 RepID=A0A3S3U5L1_9BACT|nr:hypothetical protein H206_01881 [Candidatus Electrothrix aarhusensis]
MKCKKYGIEFPADPKPSDIITCTQCSATVTYKDALSEAEDIVRKLADKVILKRFGKLK